MGRLIVISFDAVGSHLFDRLLAYPRFAGLARESEAFRNVRSVFLSNTYPAHTSVVTGLPPGLHGLVSNTEPFPQPHPRWYFQSRRIRAEALWQYAAGRGLKTAAILWPVTGGAREIAYNIPEILVRPGQSQLLENLRAGSKRLQLELFTRHRRLLNGISQPALDRFVTACAVDILAQKKPDLTLIHLTAYDTLCHEHGENEETIGAAFAALDECLGKILDAAEDGGRGAGKPRHKPAVILFSDHAQINVHTVITPNDWLAALGEMRKTSGGYRQGGAFFECAGGSAFLHAHSLPAETCGRIRAEAARTQGFNRFLTEDEMRESGHSGAAFGFCAKRGYCYENYPKRLKSQHGYPLDYEDYSVFYLIRSGRGPAGGKSLLDIAQAAKEILAS